MKRWLSLDVGQKRVGLAFNEASVVCPRETLYRKELQADLQFILEAIRDLNVHGIVVGLPLNMDGSESTQVKKVRQFIDQLEKKLRQENLNLCIEWCDERLTSWEAEDRLTEYGLKGKKRKQNVDALAACLILEDFLERMRTEKDEGRRQNPDFRS